MGDITLKAMYRYPIKGFSGQRLNETPLEPGRGIVHDRQFAITNGTETSGEWQPPRSFFINAVNDGMQKFSIRYSEDDKRIDLENDAGLKISFQMDDQDSLNEANVRIAEFMNSVGVKDDLPPPAIVERSGQGGFWDFTDTPLSILNLASVRAVEERTGRKIDPRRFRANLMIDGLEPWEEFGWGGMRIKVGEAGLDVGRPAMRCPATSVDPDTGERDMTLPADLNEHFGHAFCAMYASVSKGGKIGYGDPVEVVGPSGMSADGANNERAPDMAQWPRIAKITEYVVGSSATAMTIKSSGAWQLPEANSGQRIRFHLDAPGWTFSEIRSTGDHEYSFRLEDSPTDDPVTNMMRNGLKKGQKLVISGPYGRA